MLIVVLAIIGYQVKIDYYIMRPGSAEHLRPIIQVEGATGTESGKLMLTTVSSIPGNVLFYLVSMLDQNTELVEKEEIVGHYDMDDELYRQIMLLYMSQSQQEAIYNAFLLAGEPVEFIEKAVLVRDISVESKAYQILRPGDKIVSVDGIEVRNAEQIIEYVKTKKPGTTVQVNFMRNNEAREEMIELISHPEFEEARIGIMIMTDRELVTDKKVDIDTGRIGGSSAGMMFTLEIFNQLTPEDITRGYNVAGTGTINADGLVGQIGGVKHKVKAAHKAKADIFFVPKDIQPYDTNEKDAIATNEEIGSPLTVVPVKHVSEVIEYLQEIDAKVKK
ncbi:hypothetical protein BHU72_03030 [Desulfuribacillus stibiiarsenatis]|uniref:endopeptidase La n=1 Tax=Desulfuribacillus stibiiarsenatis TaxID=1390249 RepID=A0A1E5L7F8_9FIRM|nr:hypothetical protein BHU72_03030 [Desulfuribacillus stibiiarsenatis]